MTSESDRYNEIADWYDRSFAGYRDGFSANALRRLLGSGDGWCLDVGCGSGLHAEAIRSTGRTVVGLDASSAQLRLAHKRMPCVVRGDVAALPFPDGYFSAVCSTFTHTDVDDFEVLVREVGRVLSPGGRFVYVGVHPCFVGHAAEPQDGGVFVRPGYTEGGWHFRSPAFGKEGLRARIGERHVPLGEFLTAFLAAGLVLKAFEELGEHSDQETALPGGVAILANRFD